MKAFTIVLLAAGLSSCASLNESMTLGAGLGAAAGGVATYAGQAAGGHVSAGNVLLGAGIGTAAGLITSYLTHKEVESHRESCTTDQIDMQFGDLPPSPFVFPKKQSKKGAH